MYVTLEIALHPTGASVFYLSVLNFRVSIIIRNVLAIVLNLIEVAL